MDAGEDMVSTVGDGGVPRFRVSSPGDMVSSPGDGRFPLEGPCGAARIVLVLGAIEFSGARSDRADVPSVGRAPFDTM